MRKVKNIIILLSLMIISACSETGEIDGIIVTKGLKGDATADLRVDVNTLSFESTGGTKTIRITSNTGWVITHPDWCSLSTTTGSENATVSVTAEENTSSEARSGNIVVKGVGASNVTILVNQEAKKVEQTVPGSDDNPPPSI